MADVVPYVLLTILSYLLFGLSIFRIYLHRSVSPSSPTETEQPTMERLVQPTRINVVHLDIHFQRYTAEGALRYARLSQHPGCEVRVKAAYAKATVSARTPDWTDPRTYRICLN